MRNNGTKKDTELLHVTLSTLHTINYTFKCKTTAQNATAKSLAAASDKRVLTTTAEKCCSSIL